MIDVDCLLFNRQTLGASLLAAIEAKTITTEDLCDALAAAIHGDTHPTTKLLDEAITQYRARP